MRISTKVWNGRFKREGKIFAKPHEDMSGVTQLLKIKNAKNILDLGSGSGRHVVYLAQNGFSVFGIDNSSAGVSITKEWLDREGLSADLQIHDMRRKLPYDDNFFDAVISIQVIHHADVATIKKIIKEIERVIKKDGFIFITVPKLKNRGKEFEQIEPDTFIPLDGPEKGLPHHYFTPEELKIFFKGFTIIDIHVDTVNHYCLSAFKFK